MKNIVYKNEESERVMTTLYDRQLRKLNSELGKSLESKMVDTRFGATHVLIGGKDDGKAVIVFHGKNFTTPHFLSYLRPLFDHFKVYGVDMIGQAGRSAKTRISPNNADYGRWIRDVIKSLGVTDHTCVGWSCGGGAVVKYMEYSPYGAEKVVLISPSALHNPSPRWIAMDCLYPPVKYALTKDDKFFNKMICSMPYGDEMLEESKEMLRLAFSYTKADVSVPSETTPERMKPFKGDVMLFVAGRDELFPKNKVIKKAESIFENLKYAVVMDGASHMFINSQNVVDKVNKSMIDFINEG